MGERVHNFTFHKRGLGMDERVARQSFGGKGSGQREFKKSRRGRGRDERRGAGEVEKMGRRGEGKADREHSRGQSGEEGKYRQAQIHFGPLIVFG